MLDKAQRYDSWEPLCPFNDFVRCLRAGNSLAYSFSGLRKIVFAKSVAISVI
jgi:hypothetical protein